MFICTTYKIIKQWLTTTTLTYQSDLPLLLRINTPPWLINIALTYHYHPDLTLQLWPTFTTLPANYPPACPSPWLPPWLTTFTLTLPLPPRLPPSTLITTLTDYFHPNYHPDFTTTTLITILTDHIHPDYHLDFTTFTWLYHYYHDWPLPPLLYQFHPDFTTITLILSLPPWQPTTTFILTACWLST